MDFQKTNDQLEADIYGHVSKLHNRMEKDAEEWDQQALKSIQTTNLKYGDGGMAVARDLMMKSEDEISNKAIDEEDAIELNSKQLRRSLDEQFRNMGKEIDKVRSMNKFARRAMLDKRGQLKGDAEKYLGDEAKVTNKLLQISTVRAQLLTNARKVATASTTKMMEQRM